MNKKVISVSLKANGGLDDDYTLYEDGTILHEYDRSIYPSGLNRNEKLTVNDLSQSVKLRLYDAASHENKELVHSILMLN